VTARRESLGRRQIGDPTMVFRMRACVTAACCVAGMSAPACAQETWDETLKSTLSSWWTTARDTARVASLSPVAINMCWASDKNPLVGEPAVVAGFRKIRGNEKVTDNFPARQFGHAARLGRHHEPVGEREAQLLDRLARRLDPGAALDEVERGPADDVCLL